MIKNVNTLLMLCWCVQIAVKVHLTCNITQYYGLTRVMWYSVYSLWTAHWYHETTIYKMCGSLDVCFWLMVT